MGNNAGDTVKIATEYVLETGGAIIVGLLSCLWSRVFVRKHNVIVLHLS